MASHWQNYKYTQQKKITKDNEAWNWTNANDANVRGKNVNSEAHSVTPLSLHVAQIFYRKKNQNEQI